MMKGKHLLRLLCISLLTGLHCLGAPRFAHAQKVEEKNFTTVYLTVDGSELSPNSSLTFDIIGDYGELSLWGESSTGKVDLSSSPELQIISAPSPAIRLEGRRMIALEKGHATISVTYQNRSWDIPIHVVPGLRGDFDGNGDVDVVDTELLHKAVGLKLLVANDSRDLNHDERITDEDVALHKSLIDVTSATAPTESQQKAGIPAKDVHVLPVLSNSETLRIISPSSYGIVFAGDSLSVTVEVANDASPKQLRLKQTWFSLGKPPLASEPVLYVKGKRKYQLVLPIPKQFEPGSLCFKAVDDSSSVEQYISGQSCLQIERKERPSKIWLNGASDLKVTLGKTVPLSVMGQLDDQIVNLSGSKQISISPGDQSIAIGVIEGHEGQTLTTAVQGVGPGSTTITVSYREKSVTGKIQVE